MASTYFARQIGAGVKFPINVGNGNMHLGIEANYELGLTDTYGDKEKKGRARAYNFFPVYNINFSNLTPKRDQQGRLVRLTYITRITNLKETVIDISYQ